MDTIKCANCDAVNLGNAKYCNGCGHAIAYTLKDVANDMVRPADMPGLDRKRKMIRMLVWFVVFASVSYATQQLLNPSFDKKLMSAASELNKTCPIMVDKNTRLDNTAALAGNSFQYNYTVIGIEPTEVDFDVMKKNLESVIINNVKTSPEMTIYRDHKVTVVYNYRDKYGKFMFKISVTPEMYQ
jgi:hypothetical protein